jgi:hypothetical protein
VSVQWEPHQSFRLTLGTPHGSRGLSAEASTTREWRRLQTILVTQQPAEWSADLQDAIYHCELFAMPIGIAPPLYARPFNTLWSSAMVPASATDRSTAN